MMTDPVRPVLVGADGSAASMVAVAWAAAEARRRGVPLSIACVVGCRPDGPHHPATVVNDARDLARAVAPGLDVRTTVRVGDPVEVLSDLGREGALLVVGHRGVHGRPGPGSTSESLARSAPVPVAVVGMDEEPFPQERCTGPALPPPAAVRLDRPRATATPPLHGAGTP